ncbi:MAG: maturase, partial [Actinobacteria bacterium]|nr:maturase [Actinomycetota bacterium]
PSLDFRDPEYRRLRYLRYADDFALGFSGPRAEAEAIKQRLAEHLRDHLKLELSESKTLITHARTGVARFLGYEVHVIQNDRFRDKRGVRTANGNIGLRVPVEFARAKCSRYLRNGKPIHLTALVNNTVYNTVAQYQQEFRGVVEYYRLAYNLHQFNRLKWVMEQSLTMTLAHKLRITVKKVYDRFRATLSDQYGSHPILQVTLPREGKPPLVARWGGISLRRRIDAILDDNPKPIWSNARAELVLRLLAKVCELCGAEIQGEVHHVRALKDLQRGGQGEQPRWVEVMAARRRKALVVCSACHDEIHQGLVARHRQAKA